MESYFFPIFMILAAGIVIYGKYFMDKKPLFKFPGQQEEEEPNTMLPYARKSDENIQIAYAYLAGWIIKKNSRDPKKKVDFVRLYFQRHFPMVYMSVAKWILSHLNDGKERIAIIDFLFEIVKADGEIIDREFVAIVRLAELIGVRASYIEKKMAEFQKEKFNRYNNNPSNTNQKRTKALFTLHLSEGFSEDQLKRAYRKLAVKYHPDKQINTSEAEKSAAAQKFMEIQEAYDFLSK
jgi:DnaJ like chaperone protein